uniref:Uncharacterized protein n=1 Tax=Caenorhabditis tropicalis TaxID=1561998 RepID=A0A1I7TSI1_9PELO
MSLPKYENGLEMKMEERIELTKAEQESFDRIVSMESSYDFHRQMNFEDLKRHRDDYDNASEKILKLRKQLTDSSLDSKKRKWIEDDLDGLVRKQESALSRIKLAEKLARRDMRNDPPPAYQPIDPLKNRNVEEKKVPLDEKNQKS